MPTYYVTDSAGVTLQHSSSDLVWGDPNSLVADVTEMLAPLIASHEGTDIEADVKAAFVAVFGRTIADTITRINTYGIPHRADFETLERFVKANGLVMARRSDRTEFMREIFRGWLARNPRRGLMFLRWYLRLLYPGTATVNQLWFNPANPYPVGCSAIESAGWMLTSRVRVTLSALAGASTAELAQLRILFMSVLPARMVLEMITALAPAQDVTMGIAAVMTVRQAFTFTD